MNHQTNDGDLGPAKKIRVGIIGAGNWANYGHIPSIKLLPDYEVVAIQSRRKEAARRGRSGGDRRREACVL